MNKKILMLICTFFCNTAALADELAIDNLPALTANDTTVYNQLVSLYNLSHKYGNEIGKDAFDLFLQKEHETISRLLEILTNRKKILQNEEPKNYALSLYLPLFATLFSLIMGNELYYYQNYYYPIQKIIDFPLKLKEQEVKKKIAWEEFNKGPSGKFHLGTYETDLTQPTLAFAPHVPQPLYYIPFLVASAIMLPLYLHNLYQCTRSKDCEEEIATIDAIIKELEKLEIEESYRE